MKKIILSAIVASSAWSSNAILVNEYVKAGVNEITGTLGSGGNTSPGLLYDSTGSGTFNTAYDYLTPGSPFDGFTVNVDGTTYTNNNAGNSHPVSGAWVGTPSSSSAVWSGSVAGQFNLTNTYSLPSAQQYIDINSRIEALTNMTDLYFGRFIDPDARAAAGDSSATDNVLGYGTIPRANVVFSEAIVSRYALGLYSTDANVNAGISPGWSTSPSDYTYNATLGAAVRGDYTIGLGWTVHGVTAGDIVNFNYAYIFGPNAFGAATTAIAGGAGGGVDITTGTLVDVGSATDAATTPSVPAVTLVSTSTTDIINVSNAVNNSLPVLTGSVTHHTATNDSKVQTIVRDVTTTVTTPMTETTNTVTRSTATYSDASTVVTDGTPVITTRLWNNVVSTDSTLPTLSGRIDGISTLASSNKLLNRTFVDDVKGIQFIKHDTTFKNGLTSSTECITIGGDSILGKTKLGVNVAMFNTQMINADSKTVLVSLRNTKEFEKFTSKIQVNYASTDLTSSRTIGDFANASSTKGDDKFASIQLQGKYSFEPIISYTVGKRTIDGYTESGSIQSAIAFNAVKENYDYVSIGAQKTIDVFTFKALRSTDGISDYSISINKDFKDGAMNIQVQRLVSDFANDTSIKAGFKFKF